LRSAYLPSSNPSENRVLHGRRLAEGWFGPNAFDIIRNIAQVLDQNSQQSRAKEEWMRQMSRVIDDVQLAFDRQKFSS
jgi:hypothetical protein